MSNITEAADHIRRQAKLYEGFVGAAAVLDKVGSLEQAAEEAGVAMVKAQAEFNTAKNDLAAINKEIKLAKDTAASIMPSALAAAKTAADNVVADANNKARDIMEAAQARANDAKNAAEKNVAALGEEADALKATALTVQAEIEAGRNALKQVQSDYDKLAKAIESLKSKFA